MAKRMTDSERRLAAKAALFSGLGTARLVGIHESFSNTLERPLDPHSRASLDGQRVAVAAILETRGVPEPEIACICPVCDVETEGPGCEWCGWVAS